MIGARYGRYLPLTYLVSRRAKHVEGGTGGHLGKRNKDRFEPRAHSLPPVVEVRRGQEGRQQQFSAPRDCCEHRWLQPGQKHVLPRHKANRIIVGSLGLRRGEVSVVNETEKCLPLPDRLSLLAGLWVGVWVGGKVQKKVCELINTS